VRPGGAQPKGCWRERNNFSLVSGGFRYFAPIAKILDTAILEFFNTTAWTPSGSSLASQKRRFCATCCRAAIAHEISEAEGTVDAQLGIDAGIECQQQSLNAIPHIVPAIRPTIRSCRFSRLRNNQTAAPGTGQARIAAFSFTQDLRMTKRYRSTCARVNTDD